ncbi:unnamed protein product [Spirodela intermedia]|uniref:BZIP domain-containing protein n=1 Tax=Spirodela intermedia TaxID=51605 RepID=A0A7I8KGR3_SPIIN|nr:unnamed protein product [Spirodela intermedia]
MASSRVMASSSSAGSDVARHSSLYSVGRLAELSGGRRGSNAGSTNMEDLLRNFYAESPARGAAMGDENSPYVGGARSLEDGAGGGGSEREVPLSQQERLSAPRVADRRTTEEVWEQISRDRKADVGAEGIYKEEFEEITLEDFLARAGPETEDDSPSAPVFMQPQVEGPMVRFAADASTGDRYPQNNQQLLLVDGSFARFGNGADSGGGGRGKRKLVADPVDKASQQRQKRMIKNRESAARSRERKQAYIQQLETLAARLEEENATMREEQVEQKKARFKQLMENLIPVVEKERPPPPRLRRTCSAQW